MAPASAIGVTQLLASQMAALLAALLIASALHKLIRRVPAQEAVREFAGVPQRWSASAVLAVMLAELLAALLLWIPTYRAAGAVLAALIWGGYLRLILRAIAQGRRDVDCGCSFGASLRPLGAYQVTRNAALTGLAAAVAAVSSMNGSAAVTFSQVPAALGLLALYGAIDQAMALQPLRSGVVR
jgi:hypothetical protein